jgi:hypothetical protein
VLRRHAAMLADEAARLRARTDWSLDNALAVIGHNWPAGLTPYEQSKAEIEDLFAEAKNWLDGASIETQQQADAIAKLITDLRAAAKRADERRVTESKPFDEGKAEVQGRYNPLIQKGLGKADLAISTCKAALVPFLERQEADRLTRAGAARQDATEKLRVAQDALRSSHGDLEKRQAAELLLVEAKAATKLAARLDKDKTMARGGGRAITMRTTHVAVLVDRREAARFMWKQCPDRFDTLLVTLAQDFVDAGRHSIPGIQVVEAKVAQ